jgi:multidrug efflux pump subunit AcrB
MQNNPDLMHNNRGLMAWFTRNPVAANLLMLFLLCAGILSSTDLSKEMFPRAETDAIEIIAPYPGAAPVEVEKAVLLPMEAALQGLKGIEEVRSVANRDRAYIVLDVESGENINELMALVENRIDSIVNLPEDLEKPTIKRVDNYAWALGLAVSGQIDQRTRKEMGQQVFDEIQALPEVKRAILWGGDDYEISIEVKETRLRELNLTLAEVAQVLRNSSVDLPAGMIQASDGNVLLRTQGKSYSGEEFANIVLRSRDDGSQLLLSDVATIKDAFTEAPSLLRFDRQNAFSVGVFSLADQDLISVSKAVQQYVAEKRQLLPEGLSIATFNDDSFHLLGRLDMMLSNLAAGAILVAVVLGLFLNLRVAAWVVVGIPVSFLGAIWLMPVNPFPVNINVLSLFAFILVLGIVVDDAIVIGESVFTEVKGEADKVLSQSSDPNLLYVAPVATVVAGAKRVAIPSTIGVLTTVAAFAPLLFVGGTTAAMYEALSVVVILCLLFSLVESKLILPAHLVGLKFGGPKVAGNIVNATIERWQQAISAGLSRFIEYRYQPFLKKCMTNRYVTLSAFIGVLMISISTLSGGIARFEFFPDVPGDDIHAIITMQDGSSTESFNEALLAAEKAIYQVEEDFLEANPGAESFLAHTFFWTETDVSGNFRVELTPAENRPLSAIDVEKLWRKEVGNLPNVRKQDYYSSTSAGGGAKINMSLYGPDPEQLSLAGVALQNKLGEYDGVFDIYNSQGVGGREILISLKPYASQLGISMADVASQVRQAFYWEEVQRLQRGPHTLKVMVRYPLEERSSIATLEDMHIRTASGQAIAISEVADIRLGLGLAKISRIERKRAVTITADADASKVQSSSVISDIRDNFIPQLLRDYPSVEFGVSGASQEESELIGRLMIAGVASLFLIYGLLAVPLRSYVQPLIIMSVIPFGFVGAVIGHILFDMAISSLSIAGLIALSGVVVNDSLILVEFANRARESEDSDEDALLAAGKRRFRAILLTTLTTFVGLLPMLFETSMQAQFVIPMALSLSFGILTATGITLILIPCLYLIAHDLKLVLSRIAVFSSPANQK